jgi:aldehyde reductase
MAYSPVDEGRLLRQRGLVAFAQQHAMTPAQVALAWLLAQDGVIAIPKTGQRERLRENAAALERPLSAEQLRELDTLFPAPRGRSRLKMI